MNASARLVRVFASMVLFALPIGAQGTPNPKRAPNECAPSTVTAKFKSVGVRYSCFEGSGFRSSQKALEKTFNDSRVVVSAAGISVRGSSTAGISLEFSDDPSCRFAGGVKMRLENPCLLIYSGSSTLPSNAYGYGSGCLWRHDGTTSVKGSVPVCLYGAANRTKGWIIFTHWPSATSHHHIGSIAFRFSRDATVTGYYGTWSAAGFKTKTVAVPLAGSAVAKVIY